MLNAVKAALREPLGGFLAIALVGLLLSTALCAQTDAQDVATTVTICKDIETEIGDEDENPFAPCEQFIDATVHKSADTIKWIIGEIEKRKSYARHATDVYYTRSGILQWIIIMLSLLTTIATAITKGYPKLIIKRVDFALIPIILAALISAVTSISAYYQFDEYQRLGQNLADDLTELESDINFGLLRHVADHSGDRATEVDEETINEWHERLKTIMQRYSGRETGNGV